MDDLLRAIKDLREYQSSRALAGKGYPAPMSISLVICTIHDIAPSCSLAYGDKVFAGSFDSVVEKATEWVRAEIARS